MASPVMVPSCSFKWPAIEKLLAHFEQLKSLSPVWVLSCFFKLKNAWENAFSFVKIHFHSVNYAEFYKGKAHCQSHLFSLHVCTQCPGILSIFVKDFLLVVSMAATSLLLWKTNFYSSTMSRSEIRELRENIVRINSLLSCVVRIVPITCLIS